VALLDQGAHQPFAEMTPLPVTRIRMTEGFTDAVACGRTQYRIAMARAQCRLVVVMGVAGAGKSTVGRALAAATGSQFLEADEFHSPEAIESIGRNVGLTDEQRDPWIARLRREAEKHLAAGRDVVLACSALRMHHRSILLGTGYPTRLVYLRADKATLERRLAMRAGHIATVGILESQLAALEEPSPSAALVIDSDQPVGAIVHRIEEDLAGWSEASP
jgi:gluconokinase